MKVTDNAEVTIATRLEIPLLEAAGEAIARANAAVDRGDIAGVTRAAIVVILCADAALEAFANLEGEVRCPDWAMAHERDGLSDKWGGLLTECKGVDPDPRILQAITQLEKDRNRVAHFRGVPPFRGRAPVGKTAQRHSAPVKAAGNVSITRALFSCERAARDLAAARDAIRDFFAKVGEPLPDQFEVAFRWPSS